MSAGQRAGGDDGWFVIMMILGIGSAIAMAIAGFGGAFSECTVFMARFKSGVLYLSYIVMGAGLTVAAVGGVFAFVYRPDRRGRHHYQPLSSKMSKVFMIGVVLLLIGVFIWSVLFRSVGIPACTLTFFEYLGLLWAGFLDFLAGLWTGFVEFLRGLWPF